MTTDTFERLSKSAALLVLAIYTAGFTVVSLHHSVYGFTDLNPLRPHIIAAGTWFFLMVGLPAYPVLAFAPRKPDLLSFFKWLWAYCLGWIALQFFFSWGFSFTPSPAGSSPVRWWEILGILLTFLVLSAVAQSTKMPKILVGSSNFLLVILLVWGQSSGMRRGLFDFGAIGLWFLAIGLLTYFTVHVATTRSNFDWSIGVFAVLGGLLVFGTTYYPHIKSQWGGGEPIPVLVYMSKDSPLKPSGQVQALLIDESDAGFYFLPKSETKALFLPRSSVTLIYFGEQTKDSRLLSSQP